MHSEIHNKKFIKHMWGAKLCYTAD